MKLEKLKSEELIFISGGTDEDYNLGHAIGSHIRSGARAFGELVTWASTVINNVVPF